ncbi:MAG: CehA/McbA family metallohydrolase [Planctomycetota bacterium]|nr:CehA/McbA family metallohydrolase [Planctomycetota bacterium]
MSRYTFVNPWLMPGKFLKGNLHTHTTLSDGEEDPAERAARYRAKGYDFLAITDHGRVARIGDIAVPDGLVLIPGVELHPENPYRGEEYHFVALDVHKDIATAGMAHPQEALDAVAEQGGVAFAGHPYWCKHTWTELAPLQGVLGIEVYNATCRRIGRADSTAQWDEYLRRVALCGAIATDDCHGREEERVDTYMGWIWLKAARKDKDAIMDALRRGAYYSSCGPAIEDLRVEEAERDGAPTLRISVRTSPAAEIAFVSDVDGACFVAGATGGGDARGAGGETRNAGERAGEGGGEAMISSAEYVAGPKARYVRVEVTDGRGRKAWTNPVPVSADAKPEPSPAVLAGIPVAAPWAQV